MAAADFCGLMSGSYQSGVIAVCTDSPRCNHSRSTAGFAKLPVADHQDVATLYLTHRLLFTYGQIGIGMGLEQTKDGISGIDSNEGRVLAMAQFVLKE